MKEKLLPRVPGLMTTVLGVMVTVHVIKGAGISSDAELLGILGVFLCVAGMKWMGDIE